MKGYKVFNPDWTCHGFQYEVGKTYEVDGNIEMCKKGFHFCKKLLDCFYYYPFNEFSKIAEIEAYDNILNKLDRSCANKIKIVREIPYNEAFEIMGINRESVDKMLLLFKETVNLCAQMSGGWCCGLPVGPLSWYLRKVSSGMSRSIGARLEGNSITITITFSDNEYKSILISNNTITIGKSLLKISKEENGLFEKYYIPTILKLFSNYEVKYV